MADVRAPSTPALFERPDKAISAVAQAYRSGEPGCSCGCRRATWRRDSELVLRCAVCGGLEQAQLYAAEDAGLIVAGGDA